MIGDGLTAAADDLRGVGIDVPGIAGPGAAGATLAAVPDATHLAALARPRFEREETQRPADLAPIYLRHADAKIGWEVRGRMQGGGGT